MLSRYSYRTGRQSRFSSQCIIGLINNDYLLVVYITADACAVVPELKMAGDCSVDGQVSYGFLS